MSIALSIQSSIHDYQVWIEEDTSFLDRLADSSRTSFVIDENVWNIYAKTLLNKIPKDQTIVLPISEDRKNLDTVQELYDQLVNLTAKRNLTIISIGGGILQDITGFVASTIYRGVNWIFVPTTLLAQADSCVGSKTSLNYKSFKNLIGTFYPPMSIHIFPHFVQTQLTSDFYSGIGEVVKLHLMGGQIYFHDLMEQFPQLFERDENVLYKVIQQSLKVKLSFMAGDEFDKGRRNLLNYGHDFGHAVESTSNFAVPHGQAVIFGMLAANSVAQKRGVLEESFEKEMAESLLLPSLVIKPSYEALEIDSMINALKKDKKRSGDNFALVMMTNNFDLKLVNDLSANEISQTLQTLQKRLL